jgi:hypothetical protein
MGAAEEEKDMLRQIGLRMAIIAGASAAALVFVAPAAQAAELLTNANLDATAISSQALATPTSWTATATKTTSGPFNDAMSSESFCNVTGPGGTGLFFKAFQGSATTGDKLNASLSQNVPATAGTKYFMSGWAGAGPGYIGLSDPTVGTQFQLQFLNASSTVLSTTSLDLKAAGLGSGTASPPASGFGYHQYFLSATAPAGTTTARVAALITNAYANPAGGDQAFVVDTFSLDTVPEPASIGLASLGGLALLARRRK